MNQIEKAHRFQEYWDVIKRDGPGPNKGMHTWKRHRLKTRLEWSQDWKQQLVMS